MDKDSLFDRQLLDFISGKAMGNCIFNLGKPGEILQRCGFPKDSRIELSSSRLVMKASQGNHLFSLYDILGLDKALQTPVAVFEYGDGKKSQNVIVDIERDGKNFLVGVFFNQKQRGYEVSDIRGLFNRKNMDWIRWIEQGKMIYGDKRKIQVLIAQQRTNLAEVSSKETGTSSDSYYLDSVTSILQEFKNGNDIFTSDYADVYSENRERYKIFRMFRNAYQEFESVEMEDVPLMAAEFCSALKNKKLNMLLKFTDGECYPEISEISKNYIHDSYPSVEADLKELFFDKALDVAFKEAGCKGVTKEEKPSKTRKKDYGMDM